ncbi:flavin reductase family protein [Nocardioides sp. GXZ039]|uniref:flavin reductase family protein n=1 Tax=Nocardioides sp. GXZ039 TaxID=3136018 RepID=UPI0030F38DDB
MTCITPDRLHVNPASLRGQLARWPTGVAVVTAHGADRPIGKTVNSFHATSLEPPLVGWCISHDSSQLGEWLAAEGYVVHVMSTEQTGLISTFATSSPDRFAGVAWRPGLDGMPVLAEPVPLRLECRIAERFAVGDHTYLIGQVISMTADEAVPLTLQR